MKQLRDIGKRVNMLLKLACRHQKQKHQMDGLTVERVELDSFSGTPNYSHHFGHQFRGGVGGMPMPNPIPVLIPDSRLLTLRAIESLC